MRTPIIAGNWKMHKTVAESRALAAAVVAGMAGRPGVEVVLAPPATALAAVAEVVASRVGVAGQNMHWAPRGAYTGEVSAEMLAELASHVLVGHSERRALFGETDEGVRRKVAAALALGLTPIVCVGETEAQRDGGATDAVVTAQLAAGLDGLTAGDGSRLIVAYEPVWAIGTGRACDAAEAGRVAGVVRRWLAGRFDGSVAEGVRILYGGSVGPDNAAALLAAPEVDGALVGGASLEAGSFLAIVAAAA